MKRKIVPFLFLFFVLLISCSASSKQMTQSELDIIQEALITRDAESQIEANEILDNRIQKFHLKTDYAQKVQLLLSMAQNQFAYDLTEEIVQQYPDYVEMLTLHCVLAKKLLTEDCSTIIFTEVIKKLDEIESKESENNFNIISSQLILSVLYSDTNLKKQFFDEIMNSHFNENEKMITETLFIFTENEIYNMFGII